MNKEKILKLYKDFLQGKFVSPNLRKTYENGLLNLKDLASKNGLFFQKEQLLIKPTIFDSLIEPSFISELHQAMSNTYIRAVNEKNKPMMEKYEEICKALTCVNYFQSIEKNKVSNEDIYVITDKSYKIFQDIDLPDISFDDVIFPNDLPALFLFEEFNTVAYLNYFTTPIDNILELNVSIFADDKSYRFLATSFVLHSTRTFEKSNLNSPVKVKDFLENIKASINNESHPIFKYAPFFCNLLTFLANKEALKYQSSELNKERENIENNIAKNINTKKNKQILNNIPSYKFIDMDLTIDNYTKDYYAKNTGKNYSTKEPHWRKKHWQNYWVGKKDGSEERRKVPKFIPTTWIGPPELITEQTSFNVI